MLSDINEVITLFNPLCNPLNATNYSTMMVMTNL
jgi:hypothetical protein